MKKISNDAERYRRPVGLGFTRAALRPRAEASSSTTIADLRLGGVGRAFQTNLAPLQTKVLDASALTRMQLNLGRLASPPISGGVAAPPPPPPPPGSDPAFDELQARANAATTSAHVDQDAIDEVQAQLQIARDATAAGDYDEALAAYQAIGLPIEDMNDVPDETLVTLVVLGIADEDGVFNDYDETLALAQGLALNTKLMVDMAAMGVTPTENPPTRDEAKAYMEAVAASASTPEEVMEAASAFVDATVVDYFDAGLGKDPDYDADGTRYVFVHDGVRYEGATVEEIEAEAERVGASKDDIVGLNTAVPDSWDEAYSKAEYGGRHVGDCENTLYLMQQLLSFAGAEIVGSAHIASDDEKVIAHMEGVFLLSGSYFVTSNAEYAEVGSTGTKVTNRDIERAVEDAARDVYESTNGLTFSYAKEPSGSTAEPGVESMRRAQEGTALEFTEDLR